jgi:hypothetical protein
MIARGFKPMGWVAGVAAAALGCYMLSLNVASERAELESIERKIIAARQDIRQLQTELGTRGRLAQLDRWNAEVLALSAPTSTQFLDSAVMLARFDRHQPTIEERAKVQLASLETTEAAKPEEPKVVMANYAPPPALSDAEARPILRRASLVVTEDKPLPTFKPVRLLDAELVAEIRETAKAEKKSEGAAGGQ